MRCRRSTLTGAVREPELDGAALVPGAASKVKAGSLLELSAVLEIGQPHGISRSPADLTCRSIWAAGAHSSSASSAATPKLLPAPATCCAEANSVTGYAIPQIRFASVRQQQPEVWELRSLSPK